MPLVVDVPLNTMLADLDETLRALLKRELERHGFEGVEIAFDAPATEWSGQLSSPTVNLFLYDLRESHERAPERVARRDRRQRPRARDAARRCCIECSYAVTAWTQAVEDEHRLLSQVLAILFAYPELPARRARRRASPNGSQPLRRSRRGSGSRKRTEKADFWTAVGGQYKASLDYVVTLAFESGATLERGPEVRTQTIARAARRRPARDDRSRCTASAARVARRRRRAGRRRLGRAARRRAWSPRDRRRALPLRPRAARARTGCSRARADGEEADGAARGARRGAGSRPGARGAKRTARTGRTGTRLPERLPSRLWPRASPSGEGWRHARR